MSWGDESPLLNGALRCDGCGRWLVPDEHRTGWTREQTLRSSRWLCPQCSDGPEASGATVARASSTTQRTSAVAFLACWPLAPGQARLIELLDGRRSRRVAECALCVVY